MRLRISSATNTLDMNSKEFGRFKLHEIVADVKLQKQVDLLTVSSVKYETSLLKDSYLFAEFHQLPIVWFVRLSKRAPFMAEKISVSLRFVIDGTQNQVRVGSAT